MSKKNKKKRNRYIGKIPVNSRITIDYSKKKPEVKFEYPEKNSSQITWTLPVIIPALIFTLLTIFILNLYVFDEGFYFLKNGGGTIPSIDDCTTYSQHYKNKTDLIGIKLVCFIDGKNETMVSNFNPSSGFPFKKDPWLYSPGLDNSYTDIKNAGFSTGVLIILLIFYAQLFKLIYFKTKWGHKNYPEIMKKTADCHFSTTFTKVPKNKKIEIPLFKNIYLDYKATKGFSKNLIRMEIREHDFDKVIRKKRKLIRKKGQIFLWKATFYFKEVPKDGNLEVWWT